MTDYLAAAELFLNQHNGAFSVVIAILGAVSAIFIAIFTVVLARKTGGLYEATRGLQDFAKVQSEDAKLSIEQAARSAAAMEQAAKSAAGSLEVAKTALTDTERAFVYLKEISLHLDQPMLPGAYGEIPGAVRAMSLAPIWANSGKTPARRLRCNFSTEIRAGDRADKSDFFTGGPPITGVLGPNAELLAPARSIDGDAFARLHRREQSMFIWGWADYDDIFAGTTRHRTEFCFRVEVIVQSGNRLLVTFPIYSQFNGFDEECSQEPTPPI